MMFKCVLPTASIRFWLLSKPTGFSTLARVLESDAKLAQWRQRHEREVLVTAKLRRHLPRALGDLVVVSDARDGLLELTVATGALAASVRQRGPDLLRALSREGLDFTEIRIRVQVRGTARKSEHIFSRQWDSAEAAPLFALVDRLSPGPLKTSLARFARRARGR
jgi:hypothetical protein